MTSEGLGEMFEGDSADTCGEKFPLTSMGAERWVSRAQTREREPHRRERKLFDMINMFISSWVVFVVYLYPYQARTTTKAQWGQKEQQKTERQSQSHSCPSSNQKCWQRLICQKPAERDTFVKYSNCVYPTTNLHGSQQRVVGGLNFLRCWLGQGHHGCEAGRS